MLGCRGRGRRLTNEWNLLRVLLLKLCFYLLSKNIFYDYYYVEKSYINTYSDKPGAEVPDNEHINGTKLN